MIEIAVESVPHFMRAILVTEPHFPTSRWYFRGQADARWGIVPSSRRESAWERFGGAEQLGLDTANGLVTSDDATLAKAEEDILHSFMRVIDRFGFSPHLKEDPARVAYAQHLGLPTRLVDWTRSSATSAYFAAATALQHVDGNGRLAVFGISALLLDDLPSVERLEVGTAGNPNAIAQQSLQIRMTGDRIDLLDNVVVTRKPLGFEPTELEARNLDNHLVRVTLPWSKVTELLRVLRSQEIHAASIYPGERGLVELVREVYLTEP